MVDIPNIKGHRDQITKDYYNAGDQDSFEFLISIFSRLHVTRSECWVFLWKRMQHRHDWDTAKNVDFAAGGSPEERQWALYSTNTLLQHPCGSSRNARRWGPWWKRISVVGPINLESMRRCKISSCNFWSPLWALDLAMILKTCHDRFPWVQWISLININKNQPLKCDQSCPVDIGSAAVQYKWTKKFVTLADFTAGGADGPEPRWARKLARERKSGGGIDI